MYGVELAIFFIVMGLYLPALFLDGKVLDNQWTSFQLPRAIYVIIYLFIHHLCVCELYMIQTRE